MIAASRVEHHVRLRLTDRQIAGTRRSNRIARSRARRLSKQRRRQQWNGLGGRQSFAHENGGLRRFVLLRSAHGADHCRSVDFTLIWHLTIEPHLSDREVNGRGGDLACSLHPLLDCERRRRPVCDSPRCVSAD